MLILTETKIKDVFSVQVRLRKKTNLIGVLDKREEGMFVAMRTDEHIFRKTKSFGVNYELVTKHDFKHIKIIYEGRAYYTTRTYILKHGVAHEFAESGYEMQLFLPIEEFTNTKSNSHFFE